MGGAIRSGKTQGIGRLFAETAIERPSTYLVARLTYRELKDSTQKAMLHEDRSLPPLILPGGEAGANGVARFEPVPGAVQ